MSTRSKLDWKSITVGQRKEGGVGAEKGRKSERPAVQRSNREKKNWALIKGPKHKPQEEGGDL